MIGLLLTAVLALQDFDYKQGVGIVDLATGKSQTPEEFLKYALKERDAGKLVPAMQALHLLATKVPDPAIREAAHFERALTWFKASGYYEAYHDFEAFILKFPQSERATQAKRMEMAAALELAKA